MQARGLAPTGFVGPAPVSDAAHYERIAGLSRRHAGAASDSGVDGIDLFTPLLAEAPDLAEVAANDEAHPRSRGYARMARIIGGSGTW